MSKIHTMLRDPKLKNTFPFYTLFISVVCIVVYLVIGFYSHFGAVPRETYIQFGAPFAFELYDGQLWGLVTNSLVHSDWRHISINIVMFLFLGIFVEKRIPRIRFVIFGIYFSFITSLWQLTFSTDAGIGLSGVNMSLLGFIIGKAIYDVRFRLPQRYILLVAALIVIAFCMYMNQARNWNIGNAAMISGLICGFITGIFSTKKNWISFCMLTLIASVSSATYFYSPWSSEWTFYQGYRHQEEWIRYQDKDQRYVARYFFEKTLELNPNHEAAKANIRRLRIDDLSEKAYDAHMHEQYSNARRYYLKILSIDKNNKFARKNIQELP